MVFFNVLHPLMMLMIRRRKSGRIVCIASVSGLICNRGQVNYIASKAGLIGAAKALAVELAKRQITLNCVALGLIETDMIKEHVQINEIIRTFPMNRMLRLMMWLQWPFWYQNRPHILLGKYLL